MHSIWHLSLVTKLTQSQMKAIQTNEMIAHISQIRLFAKWGNANPTKQSMGEETKNEWK